MLTPQWQKFAFWEHLQQVGGINGNAYSQHGYDMSFVKKFHSS